MIYVAGPDGGETAAQRATRRRFVSRAEEMVTLATKRAAERNLPIDVTPAWVLDQMSAQGFRCALTGLPFSAERAADGRRNPFTPSLDRLIAEHGYLTGNLRIVLLSVNCALADWGAQHFAQICRAYLRAGAPDNRLDNLIG